MLYRGVAARLIAALLGLVLAGPALAEQGQAVDGDSLIVGAAEVRLHGIDAPELLQSCRIAGAPWPCGLAALSALARLLRKGPVACEVLDTDRYGRAVARCTVAGRDLSKAMVSQGLAVAYRRYSDDYAAAEAAARRARKGIWAGSFTAPERWRRAQKKAPRHSPSP